MDQLKWLADDALLAGLSRVVRAHQRLTADLLAYLAELDDRKLFLDLGFASLWEYCTVALGLCESTAGRHIAAARVCGRYPQALELVASGALHASALIGMSKHITTENAAELLEACQGKSARKVEQLLAARFPRADVADSLRRLATPNVESAFEPLSEDRYAVRFTADAEFRELLDRVRGLAGHSVQNGDLLSLLKHGLQAYERELEKQRFAVGAKARRGRNADRAPKIPTPPSPNSSPEKAQRKRRRPAAAVRREVFTRDEKQCSFVSADGRRCTSRHCLQLDHVDSWAKGGPDTSENLRVLCRAHNLAHARQSFGRARIDTAIAREREEG